MGLSMTDTDKIVAAILTVAKLSKESAHSAAGCVQEYHKVLEELINSHVPVEEDEFTRSINEELASKKRKRP
jgi:hypothetical protein